MWKTLLSLICYRRNCGAAFVSLLFVVPLLGCTADDKIDEYPNRPIKVIVPFAAGGGTDTFTRKIKQAIEENNLLPQPLVIVNVGGASGTIGSRRVKNARPDGYTVLMLHDAIVMAKYSGKVAYGPEAFKAVIGTSENDPVIAVRDDSPFQNLNDLAAAAKAKPGEITFGCNLGTPTHFGGLMIQQQVPGAKFRFVQTGDGAQRFDRLKGGHIDVTLFSTEEFNRFRDLGLRALGTYGERRNPAMPEVATAQEQGLDITASITQYWWMPKGTPQDRVDTFATAVQQAMETDVMRHWLEEFHTAPTVFRDERLEARLTRLEERVSQVDLRKSFAMPNLPAMLFVGVVILGAVAVMRKPGTATDGLEDEPQVKPQRLLAVECLMATLVYVAALSVEVTGWAVGYRWATFVYVTLLAMILTRWRWKALPVALALAVAMSVGLYWLFTAVFVTDLP